MPPKVVFAYGTVSTNVTVPRQANTYTQPHLAFESDTSSGLMYDGNIQVVIQGTPVAQITPNSLVCPGNVTVVSNRVVTGSGLNLTGLIDPVPMPTISNIIPTNASWNPLPTSVLNAGNTSQFVLVNGTNLYPGTVVQVGQGNTTAPSITYNGPTQVRVHMPSLPAGIQTVTVIRPDGKQAQSSIVYSNFPVFITSPDLGTVYWGVPFSLSIVAAEPDTGGVITYAYPPSIELHPPGSVLTSTGTLVGNIDTINDDTVYTFHVQATDEQDQTSILQFQLSVVGLYNAVTQFPSLVGWYNGTSWTGTSWQDKSGYGNHVTTIGGTVTTGSLNGHPTVNGTTSTTMVWPSSVLSSSGYTLIHVCRYGFLVPGEFGTKGRIIAGYTQNWFSGFEAQGIRALHGGAWIASGPTVISTTDWVLSTDQLYSYRANGLDLTDTLITGTPVQDRLAINTGSVVQASHFQIAEVLVFNSVLTKAQYEYVEELLNRKYTLRELHSGTRRVRYLRWTISRIRLLESEGADKFADDYVQASVFQVLRNGVWVSPASATNTGWTHPTNNPNENWTKLIDGNVSTKWLNTTWTNTFVDFDLGAVYDVQGYRWFTANNYPDRDPRNWTVEINTGGGWTAFDSVTDANVPLDRNALGYTFRSSSHLAITGTVLQPKIALSAADLNLSDGASVTTWATRGTWPDILQTNETATSYAVGGGSLPTYDATEKAVYMTGQNPAEEPPNLGSASGTASGAGPFTLNGYVILASSVWDTTGTFIPTKAFNKTNTSSTDCWHSQSGSNVPQWIHLQFPSTKTFTQYAITGRVGDNPLPRSWNMQGSNDGSTWTNLDTRTNDTSVTSAGPTIFTIATPGSYLYYRLYVTASTSQYVSVGQLAFPEAYMGSYFSMGSIPWNVFTNNGFTFVGYVQFRSNISNERIFDFGNGNGVDNIYFGRSTTTSNLRADLQDPNFAYTTTTNPIVNGTWQKLACRLKQDVTANNWRWTIFYEGNSQETVTTVAGVTNRTLANLYIGRSMSSNDPYSATALRELWWYDRPLTYEEVYTCFSLLDKGYPAPSALFAGGTLIGASLYIIMESIGKSSTETPTTGGVLDVGSIGYDYTIMNTSRTVSSPFVSTDWFTATQDTRVSLIKVHGDLTISNGVVFQPSVRKLYTVLYVTGDLILNGQISMTGRGASHSATQVVTVAIHTGTVDEYGSSVTGPYLPANGGSGATAVSSSNGNVNGNAGGAIGGGAARATGGGGAGGVRQNIVNGTTATGGAGSMGTCYSGGSGGGGVWSNQGGTAGSGVASGGAGGNGYVNASGNNATAGGGAGNNGGSGAGTSAALANGGSGTGGVLVILVKGTLYGSGSITADGVAGGSVAVSGNWGVSGGGGSGGGSVTVIASQNASTVTVSAVGGAGGLGAGNCAQGTCPGGTGGAGGNGTASIMTIV